MKKNKEQAINAVLDTELESILKLTDSYEKILNGEIYCKYCNNVITLSNIGVMLPIRVESNIELEFICENVECLEKYNHERK